jgi:ankyrin repeat protein
MFVQAASTGDTATLKRLISQGGDPDSTDYTSVTALHAAASNGHIKIVELLLKAGAKVDKRDINVR